MRPATRVVLVLLGVLALLVIGAAVAPQLPASHQPPAVEAPAR